MKLVAKGASGCKEKTQHEVECASQGGVWEGQGILNKTARKQDQIESGAEEDRMELMKEESTGVNI